MIEEFEEKELRKLIDFLEEKEIIFKKNIKQISIEGKVEYVNAYTREINLRTNNGKLIIIQYMGNGFIISISKETRIINVDVYIGYEKENLVIRY